MRIFEIVPPSLAALTARSGRRKLTHASRCGLLSFLASRAARAPAKPQADRGGQAYHTSLYLPEAAYDGLRERRKIHDIVLEGIELALRKRGRR